MAVNGKDAAGAARLFGKRVAPWTWLREDWRNFARRQARNWNGVESRAFAGFLRKILRRKTQVHFLGFSSQ
jgi:hypothetical protein